MVLIVKIGSHFNLEYVNKTQRAVLFIKLRQNKTPIRRKKLYFVSNYTKQDANKT